MIFGRRKKARKKQTNSGVPADDASTTEKDRNTFNDAVSEPNISSSGSTTDKNLQRNKYAETQVIAANFGKIVSVLMRSKAHKFLSLADLEWLVLPALSHNQFCIAEAKNESNHTVMPVGLVLWASVSNDVDRKLSENLDTPIKLRPDEWNCGDNIWLVEVVGEAQIINPMLKQLCGTTFNNKPVKFRNSREGKNRIQIVNQAD